MTPLFLNFLNTVCGGRWAVCRMRQLGDPLTPMRGVWCSARGLWRCAACCPRCAARTVRLQALALLGPVAEVSAEIETVYRDRPGGVVTNDDQAQMMCRFASGESTLKARSYDADRGLWVLRVCTQRG